MTSTAEASTRAAPPLTPATLLVIAGLDPSGGAGLLADVSSARALGVHVAGVATALTVQDSARCHDSVPVDPFLLERQLDALLEDLPIRAVKVGMLGDAEVAGLVARALRPLARQGVPIVVDPVLGASVGPALLVGDPLEAYAELLAFTTLLTPNRTEAETLSGNVFSDGEGPEAQAELAAARLRTTRILRGLGPSAVLQKGGHFALSAPETVDLLDDGQEPLWLRAPRHPGPTPHGTGCALSTEIATRLALGSGLRLAVQRAHASMATRIHAAFVPGLGRPVLAAPLLADDAAKPDLATVGASD